MVMATHHDALWAKLHELELQLAAYKLLRAARGDDASGVVGFAFSDAARTPGDSSTCRGRLYEAYIRRRIARRVAASAEPQQQQPGNKAHQPRGRATLVMSPRALRCAARDAQEAGATATPRLVVAPAKRTPPSASIPSTPRRDGVGVALPRSRTVSGATGSPARSSHHQRRNSLGVLAEFGECATPSPRPFLKRGTGTGGAAAPARLRATRVHDLPTIDVAFTPRPLPQQQQELGNAHTQAPRHVRSVSELPFDTALLASPQARARKRWGSPERPTAMFSAAAAADSHRDLSKGLKKLLSFVRKGGRSGGDQPFPAPSPRGSGKPVSKGWSGCSPVDVPFDRASLDGHRFPMTRAVGISG